MIEEKEKTPIEILEGLGVFMKNTNIILTTLALKINNMQVDIDKLKKKDKPIIIGG